MKVLPVHTIPTRPSPLPSVRPDGDFAAVLADRAAAVEQRAAGFGELGMFGTSRALNATAAAESGKAEATGDPSVPPDPDLAPQESMTAAKGDDRPMPGRADIDAAVSPIGRAAADALNPSAESGELAMSACAADIALPAQSDAETVAEPRPGRAAAGRAAPDRQLASPALIVTEATGAVRVAAAAGLAPHERIRFRRAAEDMLAEHGLALAELTLDGTAEPASSPYAGGPDGTRPRFR